MVWWQTLLIILGALLILMFTRYPVAFVFMTLNCCLFFVLLNGATGLSMFTSTLYDSIATFTLLPVPMFLLMGELLFRSGVAQRAINALDKLLGRIPGRMSVLTCVAGIIFAATSGSTMANTAMLGSLLVPEMEKKGYHRKMVLGPIMGSGDLAMLIPPSGTAVLFAATAQISVGKVLMSGLIPGVILGLAFIAYIIVTTIRHPELAPDDGVIEKVPFATKVRLLVVDVFPLGVLIFAVIGTILLGIATPSEAAALGALGALALCAYNRTFTWTVIKESCISSVKMTAMCFGIIIGATGFGQMLAYTGVVGSLTTLATSLPVPPFVIVIMMMIVVFIGGCFMDVVPLMMITIPIFYPIINGLQLDPIWFASLCLVGLSVGNITPPFGMLLFVMQGVAPKGTTMKDVYTSAFPYVVITILVIGLMMLIPQLCTWLPSIIYST